MLGGVDVSVTGAIDSYLPNYDVRSGHEIEVDAPALVTYQAARDLDIGRSVPVAVLFAIRTVPHLVTGKVRPSRSLTLESMLEAGFVMLEENVPNEFVMGAVGKFWRPTSGIIRIAPDEFRSFDEPGFAKSAITFTVDELDDKRSLLATETRVACSDSAARRKFSLYWRAIGPFSGFIRHLMLNEVKRTAELLR
ncbi:MAG: hypothetical protein QOG54_1595 [Actinomycetota bacterium]|nr:hypothetical protein [Actinomycetota bacterium]